MEPNEFSIEGDIVVGTFENSLENGLYIVTSEVIGSDGHNIEAKFSFKVSVPDKQNGNLSLDKPVSQNEFPIAKSNDAQSSPEEAPVESDRSTVIIAIFIVISMILVVSIIGLFKKGRN